MRLILRLSRVAALAGITTVIAVPAAAQTTGVLTGTVSDPSGAPVADAVVAIVSSAGVSVATLRTSPAGEYRSEGLDPGSYRIRVQRDGFNPLDSGPYEVSAGNVARHDLRLDIQTFGEELVVTATRGQEAAVSVPASVSSVTMDRLLDNGFYVAADELRGQPGFSFRRAEGDNDDFLLVSTRGVIGNHGNDTFLALVDGIPFVGGDEEVTMGDVPYAALERLEMVRGPVSALYGRGGIAGAINYLTLAPTRDLTQARGAIGSDTYISGDLRFGRAAGRHQMIAAATGLYSEGWREHNERKIGNVFFKDVVRVGQASALTVWANYLDKDTETGTVIPLTSDARMVGVAGGREGFLGSDDLGQRRRLLWSAARVEQPLPAGWSWSGTVHYRRLEHHGHFDFYDHFGLSEPDSLMTVNGFDNESVEHTGFFEGQVQWTRGPARVVGGANYERVSITEDEFWTGQFGFTFECGFTFFAIEIDYRTGALLNRNHPCWQDHLLRATSEATNQFASGFAQVELSLGPRATVTLGGRYDRFDRQVDITAGTPLFDNLPIDRTLDNFSPKAALSVNYAPGQYAYASFGEGFNSNFGPVWQWDPSLYIRREQPTTLRNYEGGLKGGAFGDRLSYSASFYAIRQENRLLFTSNPDAESDFTAPPNIATTGQRYHTQGLELTTRMRATRDTTVDVNYGYTNAEWKELVIPTFTGTVDLSGMTPVGVPAHTFMVGLDQRIAERVSTRVWWEHYADYYYTQDNAFKGGAYDLLNVGVTWRPAAWRIRQLNLSITNLLDEDYFFLFGTRDRPTYAVPGVPIQARVTVDLRF